ncbi:MAG: cell division FtsA domain-containing protein [Patescibacteria group bacterium]|nr:cell division FtsA domain-containing protein [Patescibacteria group bacterium]
MNFFSKIIKKRSSDDDYFISLDIGSEDVKALVLNMDKKQKKVFVVGVGEEQQNIGNMKGNSIKNISGVISASKKAIDMANRMAKNCPKKVIIGVNGEFIQGMSVEVCHKRDNPNIKIDANEIKNIIHKVQEKALNKIRKKIAETNTDNSIQLTSAVIVNISIDGYRVTSPLGFKGIEIKFRIFYSFLYDYRLKIIKDIVKKLDLELLDMVSEPYAVAMSIGTKDSTEFNSILVDIGSGTTNVAIVREGNIESVKTFNVGSQVFTKSIADKLDISISEAEDLKIKYSNKQIDDEMSEKIKNISSNDCDVLFTGIELSLSEFSNSNLLPSKLLLYGGGSQLLHIDEIISKLFLEKNLSFPSETKVKFINVKDIINVIDKTGKLHGFRYINLISLANFVLGLEIEDNLSNKILRNLIKEKYNK